MARDPTIAAAARKVIVGAVAFRTSRDARCRGWASTLYVSHSGEWLVPSGGKHGWNATRSRSHKKILAAALIHPKLVAGREELSQNSIPRGNRAAILAEGDSALATLPCSSIPD